jgi:hypothetical protein
MSESSGPMLNLIMEIEQISEMLASNSTLRMPVDWEDSGVFNFCENFKSYKTWVLLTKSSYGINIPHLGDCLKLRGWRDECRSHDINPEIETISEKFNITSTLTQVIAQEDLITYSYQASNHWNSPPQPDMSDLHQRMFTVWVILNPSGITDQKYSNLVH